LSFLKNNLMKNNVLIFGALALGAVFLLKGGTGGGGGQMFTVPAQFSPTGVAVSVPVSQLPSLGFVLYNGSWYHSSQFPPPSGTNTGSGFNWANWASILQTGLQTGLTIYQAANTVVTALAASIIVTPNWGSNNAAIVISGGGVTKNLTVVKNGNSLGGQINANLYYEVNATAATTVIQVKKITDDTVVSTKTIVWASNTVSGIGYTCSQYGAALQAGMSEGGSGLADCRWMNHRINRR
jgi:hypothetical protein